MIDLGSEVHELISTQEFDISQVKVHELKLVQELGPNQEVKILFLIHFLTTECDLTLVTQIQE